MNNPSTAKNPLAWRALEWVLISLTALVYLPAYVLLRPFARVQTSTWPKANGGTFTRSVLVGIQPLAMRFLETGITRHMPELLEVYKGNLALLGEYAQPEAPMASQHSLPIGLLSLHWLKKRTSIDYETFEHSNEEFRRHSGLGARLGLLVRCLIAGLYGAPEESFSEGHITIDTIRVHNHSMDSALFLLEQRLDLDEPNMPVLRVSFVNPACVNIARRNSGYRKVVNTCGMVLSDGIGMRIAGKILGSQVLQNVNGTDLYPRLCERLAQTGHSIYLLGGQPGVAQEMANRSLQKYTGLKIAGVQHGFFDPTRADDVVAHINASGADVLLVAMGVPTQEQWIAQHADKLQVKVAMGVGGLFDFTAGRIRRAPDWLRQLGLEWSYRLIQEPGRMWRRYLLGNLSFVTHVLVQRYCGWVHPEPFDAPSAATARQGLANTAVVLTGQRLRLVDSRESLPIYNLPLAERTVLQHQLEGLIKAGCNQIHLVGQYTDAAGLESLMHSRDWGVSIKLHLEDTWVVSQHTARDLLSASHGRTWFLQANHVLPHAVFSAFTEEAVLTVNQAFAGLALLAPEQSIWLDKLDTAPIANLPWSGLHFDVTVAADIITANRHYRGLGIRPSPHYRQVADDVWAHTTAKVSAKAIVQGPAFIGAHSIVKAKAHIGPATVIHAGCVLDAQSEVSESILLDAVQVSNMLALNQVILTADNVFKIDHEATLPTTAFEGHLHALSEQAEKPSTSAQSDRPGNQASAFSIR